MPIAPCCWTEGSFVRVMLSTAWPKRLSQVATDSPAGIQLTRVTGARRTCKYPFPDGNCSDLCGSDQRCVDFFFSQSALNLLLSQWSYSIWSARQRNWDLECAVKETSAALNASSCEAGRVWAAGAVNIHGKAEESLNAAELWKNVQASKITGLLSWSRYRPVNDGATGFPWWPYMAPASALRKGSYAW